jgi:MATE family multidrug resistance protein
LAYRLFLWAAAFQAFDAMGISSSGILRGAGDTTWPMIFSVGFAWLVFMPLLWLFGFYYGWGVEGTWASATVYIMGLGASLFIRVRRGRWLSRSLLKEDPNGVSA